MIQVRNNLGEYCLIMSDAARKGIKAHNMKELENHYRIVSSDLTLIEKIGGGSARCMVAELF